MSFPNYTELAESRSTSQTKDGVEVIRIYNVASDDPELISLNLPAIFFIGAAHPTIPNITLQRRDVVPVTTRKHPSGAGGMSQMTVTYGTDAQTVSEDQFGEVWRWSIGSEQINIKSVDTEAKQTHYPAAGAAADTGQGIGVDGDDIAGVDVYRPNGRIEVTRRVKENDLARYKTQAEEQRNTVNSAVWKGYQIGEVLFLGAEIEKEETAQTGDSDDNVWRFTYSFIPRRRGDPVVFDCWNESTGLVAPIPAIDIDPWDYVWYKHVDVKVDSGGTSVKRSYIESVHVAQVYDKTNFATFNLQGGNF